MQQAAQAGANAPADERGNFIPVRKTDILDSLVEHGAFSDDAQREQFRQICKVLAAVYHYEYFDRLEKLRHAYYYFNPELSPHARFTPGAVDHAYAELVESLTAVLKGANFVEVSRDEIERAHRDRVEVRVETRISLDDFRDVRFFRRGHHYEDFEVPRWYGLRKMTVNALVYDDVVLLVALKPDARDAHRRRTLQRRIRPGSVLIKYFRNIASSDLNALFPNVQVVMSTLDKLILGVPAIAGGIPILMKLASTVTVLFLVIGFYLGLSASVNDDDLTGALAAMSGLVALGGFILRQWMKYERQSLMYQKQLTDNIYFRNVNNNAGIFDYIIGAAEDQECKEAFLAYYFLQQGPLTQSELDRRIEGWLKDAFDLDADFEVEDALAKLDRLGLLRRDGERISVPPPADALARLDYVWDSYFQYSPAPADRDNLRA
jgi:Protein of unknown function (DUF3754)